MNDEKWIVSDKEHLGGKPRVQGTRISKSATRLKLVHVVIPQTRQDEFVQQFPHRVSEDRLVET